MHFSPPRRRTSGTALGQPNWPPACESVVVAQHGFEWPGVVHRTVVGGVAVPAGTAAATGAAFAAPPPSAPATPIIPTAARTRTATLSLVRFAIACLLR